MLPTDVVFEGLDGLDGLDGLVGLDAVPPFVMAPIIVSPIFPISGPNGSVAVVGTDGFEVEGLEGRLATGLDGTDDCPVGGFTPFPLLAFAFPLLALSSRWGKHTGEFFALPAHPPTAPACCGKSGAHAAKSTLRAIQQEK
ncbi:MAG: hypothetical protein ACO3A4_07455 [Silvanigrellaceae bacterium]